MKAPIQIRVGLPYAAMGELAHTAARHQAPVLLSAGALYRQGRGLRMPGSAWQMPAALDSGGYLAALLGGYRWSVAEWVAFIATNGGGEYSGHPFPWAWWAAMDFCSEPKIAPNRAEVERRIAATTEAYADTLSELESWRAEGVNDVPDPLPVIQGRTVEDYLRSAEDLAVAIDQIHPCTCPSGDEDCSAEWHRDHAGLPELVGVGSVCRRPQDGPEGLVPILSALDQALSKHVRLHLFGVKATALSGLGKALRRVASTDSMAWDFDARMTARNTGVPYSVQLRAQHLERWLLAQRARANEAWSALEAFTAAAETLRAQPPAGVTAEDVQLWLELELDQLWRRTRRAWSAEATL